MTLPKPSQALPPIYTTDGKNVIERASGMIIRRCADKAAARKALAQLLRTGSISR